jgi:glycosyltransferase involved in cell wall biosynthesis
MERFKICVYAICRNEEQFVDRWMDSMGEADLVVVTDTGSTDGTVERLRSRGAVVYVHEVKPWRFDVARNLSLDYVPEDIDICVCTDLDETFEKGWREKLETAWEKDVKTARYLYNWSLHEDGTPDVQLSYFKVHSRWDYRWKCPIHEYLAFTGNGPEKTVFVEGMVLNHYPDHTKSRGSYLPLLEMAVMEEPESDRMNYYLGREYMYASRWNDCINTLKNYLKLKTAAWPEERCAAMRWIAASYNKLGDNKESYRWYMSSIGEVPYMREPYVECARMAYETENWPLCLFMAEEALKIKEKSTVYENMGYAWDYTPYDYAAIAAYQLQMYGDSLTYALEAYSLCPGDERLKNNVFIIQRNAETERYKNEGLTFPKEEQNNTLIHTLLFMATSENEKEHMDKAFKCLKSLEDSCYKTVVVYNQGRISNEQLVEYLKQFQLNFIVIGDGNNVGIVQGRQRCFEYVWSRFPEAKYISELHVDMIFTKDWEKALIGYLEGNDEPMACCAIVDKEGYMKYLDRWVKEVPHEYEQLRSMLEGLKSNEIINGFNHPCIHKTEILKVVGGYNISFLKGMQCFDDDSLLLGYYYYYGTRAAWEPKIVCSSVVYHEVGGQRYELNDNIMINFDGLVRQYGAMGLKHSSQLHRSEWHKRFFMDKYMEFLHE